MRTSYPIRAVLLWLFALVSAEVSAQPSRPGSEPAKKPGLFARDNLVAWCIVPFDSQNRGPAARAEMVKRLGLSRVAYDWRENHVPTFEEEILQYQKHGIEYFAFWSVHEEAFKLFEKYDLHPQIWQTAPSPAGESADVRVKAAAAQMLPLVERTRKLGCQLGLYNHGGWGGEPENLIAVCRYLREQHVAEHVGIVYNLHHGHGHIDDFAASLAAMRPYLLCLNLNGMTRDGEARGQKILPLGEGEFDVALLKIVRESGYAGPIGIIGHTQDDVELRLRDNLDGLDWLLPQLDGKPAGPKPRFRTWSPEQATPVRTAEIPGAVLEGKAEYRHPPLTVECRATLPSKQGYNILVASDTKQSGAHWEVFSMNGDGTLTAYLPGMKPDHVRSSAMICDGQPHTITMQYEPQRIRLLVDGQLVADQAVTSLERAAVPGGLAVGRLVEGGIGCKGAINWVRLSRGVREIPAQPVSDVAHDDATLLLWREEPVKDAAPNAKSQSWRQTPEYSPQLVASLLERARKDGDAHRGLLVFSSAQSACISCHKLGRHGGSVGPDLLPLARQRKAEEFVESVLWPKREVKPEFVAHTIVDGAGRSYQGYIVRRNGQHLVFRDVTKPTVETTLPLDDIELEREMGTVMPDNLVASMTDGQLDDLLCFLLELSRDGIPADEMDSLLAHSQAHLHGPTSFPFDRRPLHPEQWPNWEQHVNRDRLYDFYAKEADFFRRQETKPTLLAEFPGLDGGTLGHWGNQDEQTWASDRWNDVQLGSVQCGVFRGAGITVPRGVCIRLGDRGELAACFNPDTLTYDAVWSGGFVKFSSVRHGFMHGLLMDGTLQPRPADSTPTEPFTYRGFYRHGDRVIFAYRIGDTEWLDAPWVENNRFTRVVAPAAEHPQRHLLTNAPAQWPLEIETPIELGSAAPYAVDTMGLPFQNPWKALLFCGGHAFLPDGSALVGTMQGDVWHVAGFAYPSKQARWRRYAAGLHHALGLVIDRDGIFVLGRDQITRLHDTNGDGEADFYECFSNAFQTSPAGHDFICGLERDSAGNFYTASGNQGLVRVSADGRRADVMATGFRNPDGLGLLPDGTVTVPCSEGEWTPTSMICAVRATSDGPPPTVPHFGYRGPQNDRVPELPLVYLPRGLDNSSGGQTFVNSDRWGPLAGQLLHFSFGAGSHFLVLRDEVDGQLQGAAVPLVGEFRSGAHRGRFSPTDGQLYVTGMQGWGAYSPDVGCFQRVRYTGERVQLPIAFHVHENGVAVTFAEPLDPATASQAHSHFAQCWNYRYSSAYGSAELSSRHIGMRGHDALAIAAAHVQPDGRTLFLQLPEIQPVNQLHLRLQSAAGEFHDLFLTVHKLDAPFTSLPNYRPARKTIQPHPILADLALATRSIPNPYRARNKMARPITMETGSNLSFATRSFHVRAGEPLALTLKNPDVVPHNWALVKPGTLDRVGDLANRMIADPEAVLRHYIPGTSDVLVYTDVVPPSDEFTIYFHAPEQPGRYPYLCTFPGHWKVMNGEMIVE